MSERARRPTDEVATEVFGASSFEDDATNETRRPGSGVVEQATPTQIDAPPSEPIRVISMKDRATGPHDRVEDPRPLHVQLRSIAEISGRHETPALGLGHLAPPRDPRQARARRMRGNLMLGCVAIALAGAIALVIWLVAGG